MEIVKMIQTIQDVTSNVLETMFFQVIVAVDSENTINEWFSQDKHLIRTSLGFTGPAEGAFYCIIPISYAADISANFLGMEFEEIEDVQRNDTVKEILNMVGGGTLSRIEKQGLFKLDIPKLIEKQEFQFIQRKDSQEGTLFIETEQSRLVVGIVINPNSKGEKNGG